MNGQQTTILILVGVLALTFYLYNTGRLQQVTNAITGNTGGTTDSSTTNTNAPFVPPTYGKIEFLGTGSSNLPSVLPSTPNTKRFVMPSGNWHYDPATNRVFTDTPQ